MEVGGASGLCICTFAAVECTAQRKPEKIGRGFERLREKPEKGGRALERLKFQREVLVELWKMELVDGKKSEIGIDRCVVQG